MPEPTRRGKGSRPRQPHFDLRGHLYRITGVDLTQIDSIDVRIAQTVISEVGLDMSRWKTEKHFASWLGLCPHHSTTGGQLLQRRTQPVVNRAATPLRLADCSLSRSRT